MVDTAASVYLLSFGAAELITLSSVRSSNLAEPLGPRAPVLAERISLRRSAGAAAVELGSSSA
jgi:hypothetical protein